VRRRWDIDERGTGVADARRLVPDAEALVGFMAEPEWVTEDPDAHLLPHIRRAATQFPLEEVGTEIDDEGVLAVELRWTDPWDHAGVNAAAFALLGSFAEEMTYVRRDERSDAVTLEIVTGMGDGGHFAPHGHTVRLRISRG
jgi:hypothetical protein